jgi:hypothetical protein
MGDEQGDKIEHKQKKAGAYEKERVDGVCEEEKDIYEDCCTEDDDREPARRARCIQAPLALTFLCDLCPQCFVQGMKSACDRSGILLFHGEPPAGPDESYAFWPALLITYQRGKGILFTGKSLIRTS